MRIVVLGGTWFIGRAVTQHLARQGHDVLVVHRGKTEPAELASVRHLHVERSALPGAAGEIAAFRPDAAVDVSAGNGADAQAALAALPDDIALVAISSGDVYRAYEGLHTDRQTDLVPLTETSPLRERRYVDGSDYENLEIEELYLARGGVSLRLGCVYGPYDYQRRFEFVLRRLRAGRTAIPVGSGGFLFSRVHVDDVASAVSTVLDHPDCAGEAFNVVERPTAPYRLFAEQILAAAGDAGAGTELVRVPDPALPPDMMLTGTLSQHLLMDPGKIRSTLGWEAADPEAALEASVRWHLTHPPQEWSRDFSADDTALAAASGT
ncbi:NAD-dependent epimerase/dehydratase family protein [Actinopolymorpha sp. B9G3]|uniref:NAD-dependent epimerase/dehydratase family protein n=1 Tax=Actinopolymorpha sp. B9G3 TaxID=3158970 RepID=UPI0032D8CEDC